MEMIVSDHEIIRDLHYKETYGPKGTRRRRILILPPGGKAGVSQASVLHAFQDAGISAGHFDVIVGISSGSFNGLAYVAGEAHRVREEYVGLHMIDLGYLVSHLRSMGLDRPLAAPGPKLLVGVSDLLGRLSLHDASKAESALELCRASSSLLYPVSTGSSAMYMDGGYAHPCPLVRVVKEARRESEEVDVFVIASRAHPRHVTSLETGTFQTFARTWLSWFSWSLCASTLAMDSKLSHAAALAAKRRQRVRIGMWFPSPEDSILPIEFRESVVNQAGVAGYESMSRLLEQTRP